MKKHILSSLLLSIIFSLQLQAQDCDLPEEWEGNTGSNIGLYLTPGVLSSLPITSVSPYIVAITPDGMIVGSTSVASSDEQQYFAIWGNDWNTPEVDGALSGEVLSFQLVDGDKLYDLDLEFAIDEVVGDIWSLNSVQITGVSYTLNCQPTVFGCQDPVYIEFNPSATDDDGSCTLLVSDLIFAYQILLETPQYLEQDRPLNLVEGWNMIGFTCNEPIAVIDAFSPIVDKVLIAKDNNGAVYLPEFGFNGIGFFEYGYGYQLKLTESISDFQFCPDRIQLIEGCMDETAFNYNSSANTNDASCLYYGCLDEAACNYNEQATTGDGSCAYAQDGYDCDGNELPFREIGDNAEGGIVFYIDDTGQHGLVSALEDLTEGAADPYGWGFNGYEWGCYLQEVNGADGTSIGTGYQNTMDIVNQGCSTENGGITAAQAALDADINGYSDWYLPSKDELIEMYNTIVNVGPEGNIGGFENNWFWSSSENGTNYTWKVRFAGGDASNIILQYTNSGKDHTVRVRVIRSF